MPEACKTARVTPSDHPASTVALLEAAVAQASSAGVDDDAYWEAVYALHAEPMDAVWPLVAPFASDARPSLRELAVDVLRCVARREPSFVEPTMTLLTSRLRVETAASVLEAILEALGELGQPDRVELALPFATHADERVRSAVLVAMAGARSPDAIAAFIRASTDEADEVRDWATFELGSQLGDAEDPTRDDIPGVVEALLARLDDAHDDTRCEAIVGLARRRDRRVLPALLRGIAEGAGPLELEAAAALGAPELCEPLRAMLARGDEEDVGFWEKNGIREAIAACCGARSVATPTV